MDRIAAALERMAPAPMPAPDFSVASAFVWHTDPDRLEAPLLRRDGVLVEVGWNEALDAVAAAIQASRGGGRPIVGVGRIALPSVSL